MYVCIDVRFNPDDVEPEVCLIFDEPTVRKLRDALDLLPAAKIQGEHAGAAARTTSAAITDALRLIEKRRKLGAKE